MKPITFPGGIAPFARSTGRFVKTGEFREPLKGEWYLSGAEPAAWLAPNDLTTRYFIMRPATEEESQCPHCKRPW